MTLLANVTHILGVSCENGEVVKDGALGVLHKLRVIALGNYGLEQVQRFQFLEATNAAGDGVAIIYNRVYLVYDGLGTFLVGIQKLHCSVPTPIVHTEISFRITGMFYYLSEILSCHNNPIHIHLHFYFFQISN